MALTSPSSTDIYFLLDESGSMEAYTAQTRQCITNMMEGNFDPKITYTVIAFSDQCECGSNLSRFNPPQHRGTQITPAFKQLHHMVKKNSLPERIIVVFVSDGMDTVTTSQQLATNLHRLGTLPVHSLLFTVGVGKDFPTGLVVDVLRPLYHMGHASVQSVLPVTTPDELHWAFAQLEFLMLETLTSQSSVPDSIDETTSNKDLMLFVQAKYNECVIKCAATGQSAKQNYTRLFETKTAIAEASRIAKARLGAERSAASGGGEAERVKPLVSNLLKDTVYSHKACLTSSLSAITRLNTMIDSASRGQIMSDLSDEAKKELLGGQYVQGKLIAVASKYRAANFGTTKNSLLRLLRTYTPNDQDRALEDPINIATQDEYFQDARVNLQDLIPLTHTLPGILKMLSFVCRTITFKEPMPHDTLQMNEWLAEVVALPKLIQRMTTFDFMERHGWSYASRGERINGLMVLGGDKTSPGIFHHVQSLLLLKHPGLFILTARLAVAGSVLFFLIGSHDTLRPWIHRELSLVDDICKGYTRQALESWHLYVETVVNPDFRICLVTESPKLPPQCKCPGLTKFILALYVAATGGLGTEPYKFSMEELKDRHHAMTVEFLARTRISLINCLHFDTHGRSEALIHKAWSSPMESDIDDHVSDRMTVGSHILATSRTLQEAKHRFDTLLDLGLCVGAVAAKSTEGAKISAKPLKDAKHYQLSIDRIDTAFRNLASICGHDTPPSFALTKPELLGALQIANQLSTGYERFSLHKEQKQTSTWGELSEMASKMAKERLKRTVASRADTLVESWYTSHHRECHSGLARIIPAQHIERFKQAHGLDIAKDWAVNSSGLSNNACCSPKCSHYLDILSHNLLVSHESICPELHQHLMMGTSAQPLPGFHKTVSRFLEVSPDRVAAKVEAGECLADPTPTGARKGCLSRLKTLDEKAAVRYMQH